MRRKLMIFFVILFFVGIISAGFFDFFDDEVDVNYINNNMTIEFNDGILAIGQVTLNSHKTYDEILEITSGKNKTVIWYEFSDFKEIQLDALGEVEFIDMKEFIVNDLKEYKEFEEPEIIKNPNYLLPIEKDYKFVYKNGDEWVDYNLKDIPKENIIIGVQTDLGWGEFLDVRLNVFNNKLDRHALVLGTNCGFVTEAPTTNPVGTSITFDEYSMAFKDVAPVGVNIITEIGWYCDRATQAANFEVGIYSDDSENDEPLNIVGSDITNAKGTTTGWKKATGLNISITAGTTYWIAAQLDSTVTATYGSWKSGSGDYNWKSSSSSLTSSWGSSTAHWSGVFAIYAVVELEPRFISAGSIAAGSSPQTPTPPAHLENDILLVGALVDEIGNTLSTETAGWTEITEVNAGTATTMAWYWKRAPGAGTAGPEITSEYGNLHTLCYVIRGCVTDSIPYEDATSAEDRTKIPLTSEITTTGDDRLVISSSIIGDNPAWSVSPPPVNWILEDDQTDAIGVDSRFTFISKTEASATTVSSANVGTMNIGGTDDWGTLTLAFSKIAVPPSDTCTCAGLNENWEVDLSDYCFITDDCNLGTGNLNFTGSGNFSCDAKINTTNLGDVGDGNILWVYDDCHIEVK